MSYDQWLVDQEHKNRGWDNEKECLYCGTPTSKTYCSSGCSQADLL